MPSQGRLHSLIAPTLKTPLAAGLIVFAVAVGTTQIALTVASKQADRQVERLSSVYLAGLAESVAPALAAGDLSGFRERFREAAASHEGIFERALFVFDPAGSLTARAGDETLQEDRARQALASGFFVDESEKLAWAEHDAANGLVLVAGLDISEIVDQRARLTWGVILTDLLLAAVCGLLAYWAIRRMNRPLDGFLKTLAAPKSGAPRPAPPSAFAGADRHIQELYRSYNELVASVRERERLQSELAEHEQAAALGRLSATIAHEIRNPLAGLATAVSTLKRFGADEKVRAESLGFLERGIEALDRIVTSTLNVYRPVEERRLTSQDFEDLKRLAGPAAEKAGVRLDWSVDLPETLSILATGARQVFLNLLLNTCAVTPKNGIVGLNAWVADDALVCIIRDEGGGMAPRHADRLTGAAAPASGGKRLGIEVIVGLLDRLEGHASVNSTPEGGSEVTIKIPLGADDVR